MLLVSVGTAFPMSPTLLRHLRGCVWSITRQTKIIRLRWRSHHRNSQRIGRRRGPWSAMYCWGEQPWTPRMAREFDARPDVLDMLNEHLHDSSSRIALKSW